MARLGRLAAALVLICVTTLVVVALTPLSASAATSPVLLRTAANFAVLAGTTITSTGNTVINGDIGVSPGTAITGLPPGQVNGAIHDNSDAAATAAEADLVTAYNDAAGRTTSGTIDSVLGGTTKTSGVYNSTSGTFGIAGTVTLDAQFDPNAVFIFKATSTLITAADSQVALVNGAQSCNVFWQVGSSATLGATSTLRGSILANTSITVGAGLTIDGRALAITGAVTMDADLITRPTCATAGSLSISAPASVDLGSASPGGFINQQLGSVTVTDGRLLSTPSWVATVTSTDFETSDDPPQTVSKGNVSYWSGPVTAGVVHGTTATPGQLNAGAKQLLDAQRTTFSVTEGVGDNTVTWNPTIHIELPLSSVAGTYTGTLTFSVA